MLFRQDRTGERLHATTLPWGGVLSDIWVMKQLKPRDVLASQTPEGNPESQRQLDAQVNQRIACCWAEGEGNSGWPFYQQEAVRGTTDPLHPYNL